MSFLLLSILSSTGIFLVFRIIDKQEVPTFPVIVINYITASSIGFLIYGELGLKSLEFPGPFYLLAIIIGILFIIMFFVVALSSQKAGMAVTSIAGKMSVVFPITFSLLYDPGDTLGFLKLTGILLAIPGVLFTIYKKKQDLPDLSLLYLPLILFIGMGVVDSLVKLAQHEYVSDGNLSLFTAILFGISACCGIIISLTSRKRFSSLFNFRVLGWGILLGTVNFGSIYFLVRTLNYSHPLRGIIDSSVVFGVNNVGILIFSALLGLLIFREKLSRLNAAGMGICILAIIILANSS
jgi:drug/metabolite transporter (DMT)-like permease